ncbi:MAG: hypothetical protein WAS05_06515 [Candidatus Nanopelagicales bacterium]
MRAKSTAILLGVILAIYLVITVGFGYAFVATGDGLAIGIGIGLWVLAVLGAWIIWREFEFGRHTQTMAYELEQAGELPPDILARTPGGRVDREAADAEFQRMRILVDQNPDDWRPWFNLATAYDAAGDRKRAREAMRHAWDLYSA